LHAPSHFSQSELQIWKDKEGEIDSLEEMLGQKDHCVREVWRIYPLIKGRVGREGGGTVKPEPRTRQKPPPYRALYWYFEINAYFSP
jgi:hypothetical protein